MTEYIQLFADTLGVSSSVIGTILFLSLALLASTAVMVRSSSIKLGILASVGPLILGAYLGFIPFWLAIVLILVGVTSLGYFNFFRDAGGVTYGLNTVRSPESLTLRIEKSSSNLSQYINNLDDLLGIKTFEAPSNYVIPTVGALDGLFLNGNKELWIDSNSYNWYLTAKHPDQNVFKVVGLHKTDDAKNRVYLLGESTDSGIPFLTSISSIYLEGDLEECALWAKRKGLVALTDESNYTAISAVTSIVPVVFAAVIILGAVNWISKGIK